MKTVLISGSSIAGPTLAWWLAYHGFVPTVVERLPGRARGGHAIDVRAGALDIMRIMNLVDAIAENRTRMKGVSAVDRDGKEVWRSEGMTISGGSFDSEDIEILRDLLSNLIVDKLPAGIETIYGDSVTSLTEDKDGVNVTFEKAPPRRFDLVVGADGLRSNIRKLVFGDDRQFLKPMGVAIAPFSAPNMLGVENWQMSYREGNESCMISTVRSNDELRISLTFPAGLDDAIPDRAGQLALVKRRCSQMGWEVPRFLEIMDKAPDFYLGVIAQVVMDRWTKGRIALVGDAGYCPSPFTGQGTNLAIIGAYVLAHELAQSPDDHAAAFARYDAKMAPYVVINQAIADLTRDERLNDPDYYLNVVEPAMNKAKHAIELEGVAARRH
jgi:2-polyprenyl-6-methoxyphenol hydroxylase-like FAD-dependent oxidoreductase